MDQNFNNTFLKYVKPDNKILDIGSGEGNFTQMFLERGAIVTTVDTKSSSLQDNTRLTIKEMKIEDFCATEVNTQYNLIFIRNIIQFLDKNWVLEIFFPWISEHITNNGIVAIETFYKDPEPLFINLMQSLYSLKELNSYFMTWKEIYSKEYSHVSLDMDGKTRKFFTSSLIVQKTHN
ncbi:hypothetical protein HOC14_02080 [bacterium]|jgi:2-polyprenyl-3-methyl-5-hydroxy-6-metoxy-1,4-benzoquinol methylase|nr:hypothetical protein [bacterium]